MNDWELLEKVSVVAGITGDHMVRGDGTWVFFEPNRKNWNPLTDDGDALRLAVKLNMSADFFDDAICVGCFPNDNEAVQLMEPVGGDPYAAARRAIVRAAAEIVSASKPLPNENTP